MFKTGTKRLTIRKKLINQILVSVMPLLIMVIGTGVYFIRQNAHETQENSLEIVLDHRVSYLNNFIYNARNDILFISRSLSSTDLKSLRPRLERVFLNLANIKQFYDQIRIIDASGMELVRVNWSPDTGAVVVPRSKLQNKKNRYYYAETAKKASGEFYLSPIDLNRERGKVEEPHKPMVRLGMPIYDNNVFLGIIIINILVNNAFHSEYGAHNNNNKGEITFITDQDGWYLHNSESPKKEWGGPRDLKTGEGLKKDFPKIYESMPVSNHIKTKYAGEKWHLSIKRDIDEEGLIPDLIFGHAIKESLMLKEANRIIISLVLLVMIPFGLLVFYAIRSSKSISMPIETLSNAAEALGQGNAHSEITVHDKYEEIERLYINFNKMAQKIMEQKSNLVFEVADRTKELQSSRKAALSLMQDAEAGRRKTEKIAKELSIAKNAAENASKAKSDFLANMSHELRTPLNSVIGFSEVLSDETFGKVNEKQKEYIEDILDSGRHLLSLINDILDLAKVESGKMELEAEELALKELLEGSFVMIKEKALKHAIKLKTDIADDIGEINVDERKLKQIIFNLLSNAAKFTPDGGKITLSAVKNNKEVIISVIDTGIGISKEDQKTIFEEFEQVENPYSKEYAGTGLGLALTKKFVELHGGKIRVESEGKDKGSTFIFTIPLKKTGEQNNR